jgi:hypothetical protein
MEHQRPVVRRFASLPRSLDAFGLLLLAGFVVGWPVFFLFVVAVIAFTGCFIECGDPAPGYGFVASLGVLALAALPFGLVRLYQRGSQGRRQLVVVLTAAAAVGVLVAWVGAGR